MSEKKAAKKKVDKASRSDGIAPGEEATPSPALLAYRAKFTPIDPTVFFRGKALWAVNYFVLWPLGLALTATLEPDADGVVTKLDVREWVYPDGELGETIDQSKDDNQADYDAFLGFVRERLLALKPEERSLGIDRLAGHGMVSATQILTAKP